MVAGTDYYHAAAIRDIDFLFSVFGSCAFYLYFILSEAIPPVAGLGRAYRIVRYAAFCGNMSVGHVFRGLN